MALVAASPRVRLTAFLQESVWIVLVSLRDPECRLVASSSKDGTVRIWDAILCRAVLVLSGHTLCVTCVQWGGEGLVYTSSQDRTIKVWRAKDVRL